jgi:hypothetical protein
MLKIYDVNIDANRPVTEADVCSMQQVVMAFGLWRILSAKIMEETLAVAQGKKKALDPLLAKWLQQTDSRLPHPYFETAAGDE